MALLKHLKLKTEKHKAILFGKTVIIFFIFGLFVLPLYSADFEDKTYKDALTSYQEEEYSTSIIQLKNILSVDHSHLAARVLMIKNLLAQGKGAEAEIKLNIAKEKGAKIRKLSPLYAKAYLLQNKFDQVLSLPLEPKSSNSVQSTMLNFYGAAFMGKTQFKEASYQLNRAIKLNPYNLDAYINQAKISFKLDNYTETLRLIKYVLKIEPNNSQALLMGAVTNKQLGKIKIALRYISKLLTSEPSNSSALLVRAVILMDLHKYDLAISDIDKVVNIIPNEPIANYIKLLSAQASDKTQLSTNTLKHLETIITALPQEVMDELPLYYLLKGLVSFQNNALETAVNSFIKYHKFYPKNTQVLKLLSRSNLALGNIVDARKYLIKAYLNDESDTSIWTLLGQANLMTGNIIESEFYFKKVMMAFPDELRPRIDLSKLLLLKGDFVQIITILSEVLDDNSTIQNNANDNLNFEMLLLLARAYQENKQFKEGVNITRLLINNYPDNSSVNQIHATLLGFLGYIEQAKHFYEKSYALDESNNQAVIHLARIEALQGDINKAISRIRQQLLKGDNSGLMMELGNIYYYAKKEKEALDWYQKSLSYDPSNVQALEKIVRHFEKNKKLTKAIDLVRNYINTHSNNSKVHLLASNLYIQNRQHDKAIVEMKLALKNSANKAPILFKQAQMLTYLGQNEKAKKSLEYAISLDKNQIAAYPFLIKLYSQDNQTEKALELVNDIESKVFPAYLISQFKGDIYLQNDEEKALYFYQESVKDKLNKPALVGLFTLYNKQKSYADIDVLLSSWINDNPNDLDMILALAENYKRSGQLNKALTLYDKHLVKNPQNIALLNNAAMSNLTVNNIEKAHDLAKRAYAISPENVNIIDTSALVELALGNANKALSLLRYANTLDYDNAEIKYHLALTLDKLDRRKEALVFLEESVNNDKPFTDKLKAETLLLSWQ